MLLCQLDRIFILLQSLFNITNCGRWHTHRVQRINIKSSVNFSIFSLTHIMLLIKCQYILFKWHNTNYNNLKLFYCYSNGYYKCKQSPGFKEIIRHNFFFRHKNSVHLNVLNLPFTTNSHLKWCPLTLCISLAHKKHLFWLFSHRIQFICSNHNYITQHGTSFVFS